MWPAGEFQPPLTRCCMRWTRRPGRSSGRAATRSQSGTIGPAFRWPTAGSTSAPSTAICIASGSRSRGGMVRAPLLIFVLSCAAAQAPDPERVRHLMMDWAGLTHYGSDDAEIRLPKPGENRVVFLGDEITELWGSGG